jgi:hypothetical protein
LPGATYRVDLSSPATQEPVLFRRTQLKVPHDPADYETKQVGGGLGWLHSMLVPVMALPLVLRIRVEAGLVSELLSRHGTRKSCSQLGWSRFVVTAKTRKCQQCGYQPAAGWRHMSEYAAYQDSDVD